ncbi:MAG: RNA polymerase subunit sigma [Leptospira sp.]|nr:MAG: RNA polymerase subunit sigma [Leptospira sp.]
MDQAKEFLNLKQYLFSIAYKITGSYQDSEDILQEAYLKWIESDSQDIKSIKAYVGTIVARLSLDLLKKSSRRKETYIGPYLPEPIPTRIEDETDDRVEFAFLVILETLNPMERAVYILREAFDYEYEEISKVVDRTPVNCRRIFSRAQEAIQSRKKKFEPDTKTHKKLFLEFLLASHKKDPRNFSKLLCEQIVVLSDGGGKVHAARIPILGKERVIQFLLRTISIGSKDTEFYLCQINSSPALVGYKKDIPVSAQILDYENNGIVGVYNILNPDKLRAFSKMEALLRWKVIQKLNWFLVLKMKLGFYFS